MDRHRQFAVWLAEQDGLAWSYLHAKMQESYMKQAKTIVAWLLREPHWMAAMHWQQRFRFLADYGTISQDAAEEQIKLLWQQIEAEQAKHRRIVEIDHIGCASLRTPAGKSEPVIEGEIYFLKVGDKEIEGRIVTREEMTHSMLETIFIPDIEKPEPPIEIPLKSGMIVSVLGGMKEAENE